MLWPMPPRGEGRCILDGDVCDTGVGGGVSKVQDNREKVIAYASRSPNRSERNYCVTKELLEVFTFTIIHWEETSLLP